MSKKMLINATHLEENRVAIVEDGILSELDIEIAGKEQTRGNIYKGTVVRVEPGLQAAFIDYGGERMGFLQLGEIHPNFFKAAEKNNEGKGRPRISDVLKRGQELLLQVVKEERGTKGAALTTFLSLPGRYMVLMPDSDTKGVSRKIEEESQRRKLKEAMASLNLPPHLGYIVRTAGIGQTTEELKRDFDYLVRLYQNIQKMGAESKAPALIYKESNLVIRSIRDYFSSDMDEVLVDDPKVFQEAKEFFQQVMPEYAGLVKLHQERRPIFARYQIEEQIETISKNKVPLPSGGSIVLDQTEALVAVDVNSGKMASEQGVEATAYKTNMEAAAEIGRQLRLRDLGGLIVIDFIDMRDRKHNRDVEKALKDALKNDKARVTVGRISQFGLMEMSRQRIKATLAEGAYLTCPHCFGSGKIKSPEAQAVAFLRKVQAGVAKGNIGQIEGEVPLDVAIYLLNSKREELHEMERQRNLSIFIKGHPDFVAGQAELTFHKREKERMEPEYVRASSAIESPGTELETESEAPSAAPQAPPLSTPQVPPAEVSDVAALPAADMAGEGEVKKKRRRRRRRKKGEPEAVSAAESAEAVADEPAAEPQAAEESVEAPLPDRSQEGGDHPEEVGETAAAPPEEEKSKPKRRRSRRKKPAATEPLAAAEAPADQEAVAAEPPTASEPPPLPAPEPAADIEQKAPAPTESAEKKPARRRSRKKPAAEPEEIPAASGTSAESPETGSPQGEKTSEEAAAAPVPEAAQESKPRRSRPRKKSASGEEPVKTVAALSASPAETEKHAGEEPAPAKEEEPSIPPRKPARSRKKAQTAEAKSASGEGKAEESRPAARKRTAKPSAKAKGSDKETVSDSAETKASSAAPSPEKTEEKQEAEDAKASTRPDTLEEKTSAEKKPKKRAPRKKASATKKVESGETTEQA